MAPILSIVLVFDVGGVGARVVGGEDEPRFGDGSSGIGIVYIAPAATTSAAGAVVVFVPFY